MRGVGRYHQALGVPIATLPMAVPVNLRAEADPPAATGSPVSTWPRRSAPPTRYSACARFARR
ncbi:hypothetical protein I553_7537 [Mycobacterium xenopi 4042]|uniref:Uncharacterized protein n=1 Tax=Mycobacterium xenopi 4042 TaxID=1299334 RepID=X8AND5_MYCXE|nr:hypothetical protein I553_7537 [Mycobacterium xenopi 4042]